MSLEDAICANNDDSHGVDIGDIARATLDMIDPLDERQRLRRWNCLLDPTVCAAHDQSGWRRVVDQAGARTMNFNRKGRCWCDKTGFDDRQCAAGVAKRHNRVIFDRAPVIYP